MGFVFKTFICVCMFFNFAIASILDQPFITVDNESMNINNEAAFISYLNQMQDDNLTKEYKNAAIAINNRNNPFSNAANVETYEDAFMYLRIFYDNLYNEKSKNYLENRIGNIELNRNIVLSELLAANRKHFTDSTIIALIIEYTSNTTEIENLKIQKKFMLATAKNITEKIINKEYSFKQDENYYIAQINNLKNKLLIEKNSVQKAIFENLLLVNQLNYDFIIAIKKMQNIANLHTWKENSVYFSDNNITHKAFSVQIDSNNQLYNQYTDAYNNAIAAINNENIDQKIIDEIFNYYKRPEWQIYFNSFYKQVLELSNNIEDFTLFVFDNNNVQIIDIFNFLKVVLISVLLQIIVVWMLKHFLKNETLHLAGFFLKICVVAYLTYYFATVVLCINPSNLTTFASAFSLAFGFGMQNIIQNFIAGIVVMSEKTVKIGDYITLADGRSGIVTDVNYRTTTLKTDDNSVILVPNSKIFLDVLENKTKMDPKVRVKISFAADKDSDFIALEAVLEEACKDIEGFVNSPAPELAIGSITKDSVMLDFRLYVENSSYADNQKITRKLYSALQAFTDKSND